MLVAGTRGYAFTGDGTFGGLLGAGTWPTTFGGPNGICHLVGQYLRFPLKGTQSLPSATALKGGRAVGAC